MIDYMEKFGKNLNRSPQAAHPVDLACLMVLLIISNVMQNDAILNAKEAGNAIWQSVIVACVIGAGLALAVSFALRAFLDDEMRDWFTLTKQLSGPIGIRISAAMLFTLFFDSARTVIVSMETTASNEFLDKTPMIVITGAFLAVCALAAHKKMRGAVRITRILAIGSGIVLALILLAAISAYDPNRLFPIGGYGLATTLRVGVRMGGDLFGDMLIVCLLLPVQRGQYGVQKGMRLSFGLFVPFLLLVALCYVMAYPIGENHYLTPPIQQLAVVSEFGRYIQRLSSLLVFLWGGAFLMDATAMLFGMARSWGALFGIEDEQPVIWGMAALIFAAALIPYELLPTPLRGRLSGYIRLVLFAAAVAPALFGRIKIILRGRKARAA